MDWIGSCVWLAGEESLILILNSPARGPLIVTSRFGEFLSMNLMYKHDDSDRDCGIQILLFGQFVSYVSCLYERTGLI